MELVPTPTITGAALGVLLGNLQQLDALLVQQAGSLSRSAQWHQEVDTRLYLVFDEIFKSFVVDLFVLEGGDERGSAAL